jgi:hypothetical protein
VYRAVAHAAALQTRVAYRAVAHVAALQTRAVYRAVALHVAAAYQVAAARAVAVAQAVHVEVVAVHLAQEAHADNSYLLYSKRVFDKNTLFAYYVAYG